MARSPVATLPPIPHRSPAEQARSVGQTETRWTAAASILSSVCLAVGLFAWVQRPALDNILSLSRTTRPGPDAWLFPAALVSTTLVLLAPGLLLSIGLALTGRRRASRRAFIAMSGLVILMSLLDIDLLRSIGRHLTEIAALAFQPQGHVAGGGTWGWVRAVLKWCAVTAAALAVVTVASQRIVLFVGRWLSPLLKRVVAGAFAIALSMFITAPVLLLRAWGDHPLVERLYASALIDVRPDNGSLDGPSTLDPRLGDLYRRFRGAYKAAFPAITAGKPGDPRQISLPARPPNVVLIVTESFRYDALGPELMPRLTRWAENGLVATHHDAGTIYSQSGMFALLYGRSPAAFHQTLDTHVPPQLCTTLRNSGYECAYFSGHPKEWLRREEYLNAQTMDHFVHDDRGTWPEWDRRALDGAVRLVSTSEKPIVAIVLLMSSHFEYRYPPEYEIDLPVAESVWALNMDAMGLESLAPLRNRYRNCMRFIDDLVGDAIGRLDPSRNLVILTGDHGESLFDDGHFTHGYSFSDVETRTPFAMVGPGVVPARLDAPTQHIDVVPSVLHALSGQRQQLLNVHGIDWFASERHASLLEAHSPVSKQRVETQLRAAGHRLRLDLDLTRPYLTLLGFEDVAGRLLPNPELTDREVDELSTAFDEQLSILRH
jgi:arylsulfatase A-like enzyme